MPGHPSLPGTGPGPGAHDTTTGHRHPISRHADRRLLGAALALVLAFMAAETAAGLLARSLALLSDAAHMLTDAGALVLALVAIRLAARPPRGGYTYGLKRAEILSAQANGVTLLLLAILLAVTAVHRLLSPPPVLGGLVLVTALVGVAVNLCAAWLIRRADRSRLDVEGAFQHILTDLYAFLATAVAGLVIVVTGFTRADALATMVVVALMVRAGIALLRESGRILLEAAPAGLQPDLIGARLAGVTGVTEIHDLHIWQITSGEPALSAHVLVQPDLDCHATRHALEDVLHAEYGIEHTTMQVDHAGPDLLRIGQPEHCAQPHGAVHRAPMDRSPPPPAGPPQASLAIRPQSPSAGPR